MGCVEKGGRWMLTLFVSVSAGEESDVDGKAEGLDEHVNEPKSRSDSGKTHHSGFYHVAQTKALKSLCLHGPQNLEKGGDSQ